MGYQISNICVCQFGIWYVNENIYLLLTLLKRKLLIYGLVATKNIIILVNITYVHFKQVIFQTSLKKGREFVLGKSLTKKVKFRYQNILKKSKISLFCFNFHNNMIFSHTLSSKSVVLNNFYFRHFINNKIFSITEYSFIGKYSRFIVIVNLLITLFIPKLYR